MFQIFPFNLLMQLNLIKRKKYECVYCYKNDHIYVILLILIPQLLYELSKIKIDSINIIYKNIKLTKEKECVI